ncbi:hypothetical protein J6590_099520 [Homalodisca vitripennis]|nr:hypothetical protein J6590_099520 [Homalodisca vitripennis]
MSCKTEEHHKEISDVAKHTAGWPHPNMLTWPCPLYYVLRIRTIASCRAIQKNITRRAPCPLYYVHRIRTIVSCRAIQKNTTRRAPVLSTTFIGFDTHVVQDKEHTRDSDVANTLLAGRIQHERSPSPTFFGFDDRIMSCKTEEHQESSDVAKHTAGGRIPTC